MKKFADKLFWPILLLFILFFLYQKGYILANFTSVETATAQRMLQEGNVTLLDVRTKEEYAADGRIEGAVLIPLATLDASLSQLDAKKRVLVYCRSGNRSVSASRILADKGFEVYNLKGGIGAWKSANLPVQR